uniref:Secreted protein n=1 Tax=Ixodes ricinus TaxID=34613 RepID=A0A6B0UYE5_IXORI
MLAAASIFSSRSALLNMLALVAEMASIWSAICRSRSSKFCLRGSRTESVMRLCHTETSRWSLTPLLKLFLGFKQLLHQASLFRFLNRFLGRRFQLHSDRLYQGFGHHKLFLLVLFVLGGIAIQDDVLHSLGRGCPWGCCTFCGDLLFLPNPRRSWSGTSRPRRPQ